MGLSFEWDVSKEESNELKQVSTSILRGRFGTGPSWRDVTLVNTERNGISLMEWSKAVS
jgi:hypothetical protein